MVLRRGASLTEEEWDQQVRISQQPYHLLHNLKELAEAIAKFSTRIISPFHSALNDLLGECAQLNLLLDCLTPLLHPAHHTKILPINDNLFLHIEKLTALQMNLSLILQNMLAEPGKHPEFMSTAQDISDLLREFAQVYRTAAIVAAQHCRNELHSLFLNNIQQTSTALIAARSLLMLAQVKNLRKPCALIQRCERPDQLIFTYDNLDEASVLRLYNWLISKKVTSVAFTKIENMEDLKCDDSQDDDTAHFQFEEDLDEQDYTITYEIIVDASEFSQFIMPLIRTQVETLIKTPRSQSFSAALSSSGRLWSNNVSPRACVSQVPSDDERESSEHADDRDMRAEVLRNAHLSSQPGSANTTPRASHNSSPRSLKNGSGMLATLKTLGSSGEKTDILFNSAGSQTKSFRSK